MSQLPAAMLHMAEHEGMTDLFCWHVALDKLGRSGWHASCKIEQRSCFVSDEHDNPVDAMLDALTQAWNAAQAGE